MPCLLLRNGGLVKTIGFRNPRYVGDPVNAIRIFNEMGVDELVFLDISATPERRPPRFDIIEQMATECFMPFAYGGGVRDLDVARRIFRSGVEKICLNTVTVAEPSFVRRAADAFGSQAVVASIDVKRGWFGRHEVVTEGGRKRTGLDPVAHATALQASGAGEILLTSVDRDGTMEGYDVELTRRVTSAVDVPVIACGGAGRVEDFGTVVKEGGASAVAAGSMVVYQGKHRGVLINFPDRHELERVLSTEHEGV